MMFNAPPPVREQVLVWGPDAGNSLDEQESVAYCRSLAGSHYENFSVITSLVPPGLRDDFAAVYGFCRWADDLGDEMDDPAESRRLLDWWRDELRKCFAGAPEHPVMVALSRTVRRHDLPIEPFIDLIDAFLRDQNMTRYRTWSELIDYCRLSANPVGRLVLMLLGEPRTERLFRPSDAICTALQLTNHWQDVGRDIIERDRIYIPEELIGIDRFEERLRASAIQGWAVDGTFLEESRQLVRQCVERTWPYYTGGDSLLSEIAPAHRPMIRLFRDGGMHMLRLIETWDCETALHRPRLGRARKFMLFARAWVEGRFSSRGSGSRR
jgi:squalene synthase HpnC